MADIASGKFQDAVPAGDALVNLAAEHRDDVRPVRRYDEVNVGGARNLCAAAVRRDIRTIVFSSSVAVYGEASRNADESTAPQPVDPYGRSKLAAEAVYRQWQAEDAGRRALVIVRPTAVFGEHGGGNVNLLLAQLVANRFVMVGDGRNVKSLAYVENVAAFIEFCLSFAPGVHVYNYVDKPDMTMNELVSLVRTLDGRLQRIPWRVPFAAAYAAGALFDAARYLTRLPFPVSAARVRKFCRDSQFATAVENAGFVPPVSLRDGLAATVRQVQAERTGGVPR